MGMPEVRALLRLFAITALVIGAYLALDFTYNQLASPIEAQIAVRQLDDNAATYAAARAASTTRLIPTLAFWGAVVLIVVLWARFGLKTLDVYLKGNEEEARS